MIDRVRVIGEFIKVAGCRRLGLGMRPGEWMRVREMVAVLWWGG